MTTTKNHSGLTPAQVEESRKKYGQNILTPTDKQSVLSRFLEKFKDPLIIILLIAGTLSFGIALYEYYVLGESWNAFAEPLGILIAILLATTLSFIFELRADKEFNLLNQVNDDEPVIVIRGGKHHRIPKRDVVVGDVIILSNGDEVPADGRLIEAVMLSVDESSLTGEPICHKTIIEEEYAHDATYPSNMVYRGTKVMEGHGVYIVEKVGDATECGKVFKAAQIDSGVKTPLNEQLDRLGLWISRISYVLAALIMVGRIIMYLADVGPNGIDWVHFSAYLLQSVMIAVTLIVVAVPEGLPMAVTLSLAYSMRRMLKTNNLVRKLHACETMGAATVICTDKTGTLTQNIMSVADIWFLDESRKPENEILWQSMAVNSTASLDGEEPVGNPTEGAFLKWLRNIGIDYRNLRDNVEEESEVPFTTEAKYMAMVVKNAAGHRILFVKGAPEIVCAMCSLSDSERMAIKEQSSKYQSKAMRMLAFAYKYVEDGAMPIRKGILNVDDLSFVCLAAISDPIREDVPDAVAECLDAGIEVKIVTGDTLGTAIEIGRQIGIWTDNSGEKNYITGPELAALSDDELRSRVKQLKIIARARPTDKERLVKALQAVGEIVAVTGDGTNDAPALNAAHVGLSMGDGTSVAKEASDITILDNSFASIGRAVMWGRTLYQNIQRFILFQMTVNVAACLIVLAGAFMGVQSPLTVTQMLWINLIMDTFAAMALSSLPPEKSVMKAKPRNRKAFIISKKMIRQICIVGGSFCIGMIGFAWLIEHSNVSSITWFNQLKLEQYNVMTEYEMGFYFTTFVFLQFWNLFNAKAFGTNKSAFHFKDCGSFLFIATFILVGQLIIVYCGGEFFNVKPLSISDMIIAFVVTSCILWIGELLRWLNRLNKRIV